MRCSIFGRGTRWGAALLLGLIAGGSALGVDRDESYERVARSVVVNRTVADTRVAAQPSVARQAQPGAYAAPASSNNQCGCDDPCANGGGGRRENRRSGDWSNCACNGSYKYPVPPLYTYHWPGMYSQQLMTDYHSPWRFPPLRPYVDEAPIKSAAAEAVQAATALEPLFSVRFETEEPMSEKIKRYYGIR